jgi:hypothetical protein
MERTEVVQNQRPATHRRLEPSARNLEQRRVFARAHRRRPPRPEHRARLAEAIPGRERVHRLQRRLARARRALLYERVQGPGDHDERAAPRVSLLREHLALRRVPCKEYVRAPVSF